MVDVQSARLETAYGFAQRDAFHVGHRGFFRSHSHDDGVNISAFFDFGARQGVLLVDASRLLTLGINTVDEDEIEVSGVLVLHLLEVLTHKIRHGVNLVMTGVTI